LHQVDIAAGPAWLFAPQSESCRQCGLDAYGWQKDVLRRLPSMTSWQFPEVTPETWNKKHPVVL
jgi:hypothetical protein